MSHLLKTMVVDDEPLARQNLIYLLEQHADVEVVASCANGFQALQALEQFKPDLMFLDVQMPQMTGLEVMAAMPEPLLPSVIFATAYDAYAIQAFEVNAVDYLLKPIVDERFEAALARARQRFTAQQQPQVEPGLMQLLAALEKGLETPPGQDRETVDRFMVKLKGCFVYVEAETIDYFEAAGNYVGLHVGKQVHLIRETLTHLEQRLDPSRFLRISRSQILNVAHAKAFEPHFQGEYVVHLSSGSKLKMSRRYRKNWQHLFKDAYS